MFNKISNLLLMLLMSVLPLAAAAAQAADAPSPEQVVAKFQKLPHYEIFCKDETWSSLEPGKSFEVGKKFEPYFSKELYKLFLWEQCHEPQVPPHDGMMDHDVRFGFLESDLSAGGDDTGREPIVVKNIRVGKAEIQGADKATVEVSFDSDGYSSNSNFVTIYKLVREDGRWKIDDISPQGNGSEDELAIQVGTTRSVKDDMQGNYNYATDIYSLPKSTRDDIKKIMAAVLELSHQDLSCRDENWRPLDPVRFSTKLEPYFTQESYKLLLWSQCGEPQLPSHYTDLKIYIPWDIRFGFGGAPNTDAAAFNAKNIVIGAAEFHPGKTAQVDLKFESPNKSSEKETSTFYLELQDGLWKIKDIATPGPHAALPGDPFRATGFKFDLKEAHEEAEKRDKQQKGAVPKH